MLNRLRELTLALPHFGFHCQSLLPLRLVLTLYFFLRQADAIGATFFSADALGPLLRLVTPPTTHSDPEVVRHVSRTLAELARVCVMARRLFSVAC